MDKQQSAKCQPPTRNEWQMALQRLDDNEYGDMYKDGRYIENLVKDNDIDIIRKYHNRDTKKKAILVSDYDGFVYECPVCHNDFRPNYVMRHIEWKGCPYCLHELS